MQLSDEDVRKLRHDLSGLIYILQTLDSGVDQGEPAESLKVLSQGAVDKTKKIILYFNQKLDVE